MAADELRQGLAPEYAAWDLLRLTERERVILEGRIALPPSGPIIHARLGHQLGISRTRVGTIEQTACVRLCRLAELARLGVDLPDDLAEDLMRYGPYARDLLRKRGQSWPVRPPDRPLQDIETLGLSPRVVSALMRHQITTIDQVAHTPDTTLLDIPRLGPKTLRALRAVVPYQPPRPRRLPARPARTSDEEIGCA